MFWSLLFLWCISELVTSCKEGNLSCFLAIVLPHGFGALIVALIGFFYHLRPVARCLSLQVQHSSRSSGNEKYTVLHGLGLYALYQGKLSDFKDEEKPRMKLEAVENPASEISKAFGKRPEQEKIRVIVQRLPLGNTTHCLIQTLLHLIESCHQSTSQF
jgi:hypothetical protein